MHDSSLLLSTALIKWNKQIFGDVFHAKHWLLARIDGIQKVPDYHLHPYFSSLERESLMPSTIMFFIRRKSFGIKNLG